MISNDDKIGDWYVEMYAGHNIVASFQCPTIDDVFLEMNRIRGERAARGLENGPTRYAQIVGRKPLRLGNTQYVDG